MISKKNKIYLFSIFYKFLHSKIRYLTFQKYFSIERANLAYSQEGEDLILARFFEKLDEGFYCDVGAFHPKQFSNTHLLYLRGWTGINIDPTPGMKVLFDKYRPKDINLELGISPSTEKKLKYTMYENPVYNSFKRSSVNESRIVKEIEVNVSSLEEILKKYLPKSKEFCFLNIDVEGYDFEVLISNNWDVFRPKLIAIEFYGKSYDEFKVSNISKFLTEKGYTFFAKTVNTYFMVLP